MLLLCQRRTFVAVAFILTCMRRRQNCPVVSASFQKGNPSFLTDRNRNRVDNNKLALTIRPLASKVYAPLPLYIVLLTRLKNSLEYPERSLRNNHFCESSDMDSAKHEGKDLRIRHFRLIEMKFEMASALLSSRETDLAIAKNLLKLAPRCEL